MFMLVENIIEVVIFIGTNLSDCYKRDGNETLATETKEDNKDMIRVFVRFSFKD